MASTNVADLTKTDDAVTIGAKRHAIIAEATIEIGFLCELLRKHKEPDFATVRGLSARIEDLARIACSGLDDEREQTTDLARDLYRS